MKAKAVEMGLDPNTVTPEDLDVLQEDSKGRLMALNDFTLLRNTLIEQASTNGRRT